MGHPLGWSYPAGAENDPNAPYNQEPEPDSCPVCGGAQHDENNEPLHPSDPIFCSDDCETAYRIMLENEDESRYNDEGGGSGDSL